MRIFGSIYRVRYPLLVESPELPDDLADDDDEE